MNSEIELRDLAARFVLASLRSASTDKIRPIDWWPRARTALETAAGTQSFSMMVTKMAKKLQVETLIMSSNKEIFSIGEALGTQFAEFRKLCMRESIYIVAMAQMMSDQARDQEQPF